MEIGYVPCVRHKWRYVVKRRRLFSYRNLYTARSKYEWRKKGKKIKTGNSIPLSMSFELVCIHIVADLRSLCTTFFPFVFRSFVCHAFMYSLLHTRFHFHSGFIAAQLVSFHKQRACARLAFVIHPWFVSLPFYSYFFFGVSKTDILLFI